MTSIGETLRRERLRLGLDLDQVAERTKIGTRLLQAMEADDFEKLPGGVFTRSFIKQYARILGLDEEAIGAEFKTIQQRHEESPPPPQGFRSQSDIRNVVPVQSGSLISNLAPRSRSVLISAAWVFVAIGVCAAGYYMLNRPHAAEVVTTDNRTADAPGTPDRTPPVPESTVPKPDIASGTPSPTLAPATQAPVTQAPPSPAAPSSSPVQVLVKASEDSWISVFVDGRNKFTGVLQANQSKQVDADERVRVIAGNSGGLEISLNGKSIGPIGRTGQRRIVELTPDGAHVVRRTSAASSDPLL